LWKNRSLTFLNVSGLAIGVTVCLLIAVWLQRELSFDDFHPDGERIFRLANTFKSESESFSQAPSGFAFGAQLRKQLSEVKATCRVLDFEYKFKANNKQFFEPGTLVVDSNFFVFFGYRLEEGSPKQVLNSPDKIVISEKAAIKYFGTTKDIIGKTMLMDDRPMKVAGVAENAPPNSHLQYDIVIPFDNFRKHALTQWKEDLDNEWVGGWPYVYVQLANPSEWKKAEANINKVAFKFEEKDSKENKMSYRYFLQPIRTIHLESSLRYDSANNGSSSSVKMFSIVGLIVLLLACINYINLTTAGAIRRAKETSVRKVVGATKWQLVRQFFLETLAVCTLAVIVGVMIFKIILPPFSAWIGQFYTFSFTGTNLLILLAFIALLSVISGIYPAIMLSSFNPAVSLKGSFSQSRYGNLVRKTLIVFQFTVTIALVASILIITRQMNYIKNRSLGFNGNAVVEVIFNGDEKVTQSYRHLRSELLKSQYILNVTEHLSNVVGGLGNGWTSTENSSGEEVSTSIYRLNVDPDYFDTYGMKLAAGRFFSWDIPTDSTKSVLVNEAAVRTFGWKNAEDAIGKRFGKGDEARHVIGVVRDFNFESLHKPVDALLIGYLGAANQLSLKIDATHIHDAINHLSKTWKQVVADVPLEYVFVDDRLAEQYGNEQKMEGIFYGFSLLSLLIACFGLFGLTTFVVERKTKEIGIRKVLGANASGIVGLLSRDFLKLVFVSLIIATPLAWFFMNNWLRDFAYRVRIQWWVFVAAGAIAILIALLTVSIQSVRAAIANPVKSLRTE